MQELLFRFGAIKPSAHVLQLAERVSENFPALQSVQLLPKLDKDQAIDSTRRWLTIGFQVLLKEFFIQVLRDTCLGACVFRMRFL